MPTDMFCFNVDNKWVHVYTINDLLDAGQLPVTGHFIGADGKTYTLTVVDGKYRLAKGADAPNPIARLNIVYDNVAGALAGRLAGHALTVQERQARLVEATTKLNAIRNTNGLTARFTAMWGYQFGHPSVDGAPPDQDQGTQGNWLHQLFCH